MLIEFTDGSRVAGSFAKDSMALTSPEVHGLFLEEEWLLNEKGDIEAELPGTSGGLLIPRADEIRWVRVSLGQRNPRTKMRRDQVSRNSPPSPPPPPDRGDVKKGAAGGRGEPRGRLLPRREEP